MGGLGISANADDGLAEGAGNAPSCATGRTGGGPNAARATLGALAGREEPSNGAQARW